MPRRKSDFAKGLEFLLNSPTSSPTSAQGNQVFKQMSAASQLPTYDMLRYLGKKGKGPSAAKLEQQRIEQRQQKLEQD